ncbi:MAG TPA: glycoside hydrolase family 172 protein [Chitinophaga sp.]
MRITIALLLCLLGPTGINRAAPPDTLTMATLLRDMTDPATVARFPAPAYTLRQASSYDRHSISPDRPGWFANGDFNQFIRQEERNGHTEYVMMDAEGPGAIVRFWLTALVKAGTLRFYFDNAPTAAIEIPGYDLMRAGFDLGPGLLQPHSSYEPQGKGGNTLYLPLLYQQHCKVTWEFADSANRKTPHYYQVNYRTYAPGTVVETFAYSQLARYRADIDKAEALLWRPPAAHGSVTAARQTLAPGQTATLTLPAGAHAIRQLQLALQTSRPADREKMWRSVILHIRFDGAETVRCPLGDFIGSGYGGKPIRSWYRELTDTGGLTSRWVMPYRRSATITVENQSNFAVDLRTAVTVSPFRWDNRTMYFHATYKFERGVKDAKWDYDVTKVALHDTAAPIDWNFATLRGQGVYLGNTLSVDNHMKSWYGEGDAKAYVDGEKFPSEFGTGLEDYYNTSWAPVVLYQTPFANAPRADQPSSAGFNTFTRTRILDAIPFYRAFSFDMEMLSWDGGTIDSAATTYWYGLAGATGK